MYPLHTSTVSRPNVTIRTARETDRDALEAIAAQTWGGDDYLARVLDDWFSDPYGGFFVATLDDEVIGVTKLTRYAPGEWWMEGLRVAPSCQGQGLGRILHHFVINQLRQIGDGEVRFSTGSPNEKVQQFARETGFTRTGVYLPYGAEIDPAPVAALYPLGPDDLPGVHAYLDSAAHYSPDQRNLENGWSFYRLTDARLRAQLSAGLAYGWPVPDRTLGGLVIANPTDHDRWPGEPALKIAYLDVPTAELTAAAGDIRRLAAQLERTSVEIKLPGAPDDVLALEAAGFTRTWDGEAWLYARGVVLTEHADVRIDDPPARQN